MQVIVKANTSDDQHHCRRVIEWPHNVRLPNSGEFLYLGSSDGLKVKSCSFFIDGPGGPGYEPETDAPNWMESGTLYTVTIHIETDRQSLANLVDDCQFSRL